MKRCPKCRTDYFDNMLDFCLDDGERLQILRQQENFKEAENSQTETAVLNNYSIPTALIPPTVKSEIQNALPTEQTEISEKLQQKVTRKWLKILEIFPIFPALAHNYWQWLYLERKSYYDFTSYFLSLDFIIWTLLLITALVFGIISLKYSKQKGFAITALVVLAINVLFSIVPK